MPDEPIDDPTVETPPAPIADDVPPAENQETEPVSEPPGDEDPGRTAEPAPTVESLTEELSRATTAKDKAERHARDMEGRSMRSTADSEKMRVETQTQIRNQLADMNRSIDERLDSGTVTREELNQRDALIRQDFELQNSSRADEDHNATCKRYGDELKDKATAIGMDEATFAKFLDKHSTNVLNQKGDGYERRAFAEYADPAKAFEMASICLEHETRGEYEQTVRQNADSDADAKALKKMAGSLPAGVPQKEPGPPPDSQQSYKDAVLSGADDDNPDNWA